MAGTEKHYPHVVGMFSSQALTLQLAVQSCHVQTDSLHQSRLMFVPREICFHSHLDNVTCGRLGRGQLCPWGNACWLRNNYYLYFLVKMQTRNVWAHFLALSWTSRPSLGFFSPPANVLAMVLSGFTGILWAGMMGT